MRSLSKENAQNNLTDLTQNLFNHSMKHKFVIETIYGSLDLDEIVQSEWLVIKNNAKKIIRAKVTTDVAFAYLAALTMWIDDKRTMLEPFKKNDKYH